MLKNNVSQGFTYIGLMFILTLIGIMLALAGTLWSFAQHREQERQLMFVGKQFQTAIRQYYEKTPGTVKRYPNTLEDLLQDNRYVSIQRYLRTIYIDPITHTTHWGLVRAPDGGIMGIYSESDKPSIRTRLFDLVSTITPPPKRVTYADWKFVYTPIYQSNKPIGK